MFLLFVPVHVGQAEKVLLYINLKLNYEYVLIKRAQKETWTNFLNILFFFCCVYVYKWGNNYSSSWINLGGF